MSASEKLPEYDPRYGLLGFGMCRVIGTAADLPDRSEQSTAAVSTAEFVNAARKSHIARQRFIRLIDAGITDTPELWIVLDTTNLWRYRVETLKKHLPNLWRNHWGLLIGAAEHDDAYSRQILRGAAL
jgi:hypothetical protein